MSLDGHTDFKILLGKRIQSLRESKGMTQKDLAFETELDISTISRLERGILNPRLDTILSLSAVLKVHPKQLFDF